VQRLPGRRPARVTRIKVATVEALRSQQDAKTREIRDLGVKVVAPAWRDDLCLQIAAQLEQALPWRDRRPTIA
jgi:Asp-tRNA(Asn)/Glu-tRNA(Gln) amidotransferase A subunit family amidase